jgi:hypothetical protein
MPKRVWALLKGSETRFGALKKVKMQTHRLKIT